ncbi:iron chaperone [Sphingobacterium sp. HJSM2_6]|uniref:iron chaperone n=1 Tax=Sphingobacterium sp. HJSM2_6 TaxID=3366264 RepID=UPI003BEC9283
MAKTNYKNIDEYHHTVHDEIRNKLESIREIVHQVAPQVEEVISYQIPAFKIGNKYLIYYSAYPKHISLSSPWTETFLKKFEKELKLFKVSKSAIQFPNDQNLPLAFIQALISFRKKEVDQT